MVGGPPFTISVQLAKNNHRTIGGDIKKFEDVEMAKKVGIGYTCVAAQAFRDYLAGFAAPQKPFRFVYCSARGAERDQHAKLWVQAENRKLKVRSNSRIGLPVLSL